MGNRKAGKQNSGGVIPPQQGRIMRQGHKPGEVAGGRAALQSVKGYPPMSGVRGGVPPKDTAGQGKPESHFRSGGDTMQGKIVKGVPISTFKAGAAPTANMTPPGGGKSASDLEQNRMDVGRRGFAKGGKIDNGDSGGKKTTMPSAFNKSGQKGPKEPEYPKGSKRDPKEPDADDKYARGGKVNRHGVDGPNGGVDKNPKGTSAPANGGNGGLPGGNAAIPLAQPGGTPSTGVTASGRMQPSWAGADTGALTPDSGGVKPKLRTSMVKRAGGVPSLPRPRRG
jgi:hypothetical protein